MKRRLKGLLPWLTAVVLLASATLMARMLSPSANRPATVRLLPTPKVDREAQEKATFERLAKDFTAETPLAEVRAAVQVETGILLSKEAMQSWSERVRAGEAPAEVLQSLVRQTKETP